MLPSFLYSRSSRIYCCISDFIESPSDNFFCRTVTIEIYWLFSSVYSYSFFILYCSNALSKSFSFFVSPKCALSIKDSFVGPPHSLFTVSFLSLMKDWRAIGANVSDSRSDLSEIGFKLRVSFLPLTNSV